MILLNLVLKLRYEIVRLSSVALLVPVVWIVVEEGHLVLVTVVYKSVHHCLPVSKDTGKCLNFPIKSIFLVVGCLKFLVLAEVHDFGAVGPLTVIELRRLDVCFRRG